MLSGKDNGKDGKIVAVFPSEERILVEGLNLIKKHVRPRREGEKGQRVEIPRKVDISNVALICPKCGKPTRIGFKETDKQKVRFCKKCKSEI